MSEAIGEGGAPLDAGSLPGEMRDQLEILLSVQDLDINLSQLDHRLLSLSEREQMELARSVLTQLKEKEDALRREKSAIALQLGQLEDQVKSISDRTRVLEDRLYHATGSSARDLQAIDGEVHQLAKRRSEFEDQELELMIAQEPLDAALEECGKQQAVHESSLASLTQAFDSAEKVVQSEIITVRAKRAEEFQLLPTAMRDHYETLRSRLSGVGVARLIGNHCDGCHLELPSAEVDRIRHQPPGTIVTCSQCGRILVRQKA